MFNNKCIITSYLTYYFLNGGKLVMIKNINEWFLNLPLVIQISFGWLVSCLLTLCVVLIIYNPIVLAILLLIGISIAAFSKILLYYLFDS